MTSQSSLEHVASSFHAWRKQRSGRTVRTPETLRQQAVGLLTHHTASEIIQSLKITRSMLKTWQQTQEVAAASAEFISLPGTVSDPPSAALQITLRYPGGTELQLAGSLSPAHIAAVVEGLNPVGCAS